jgi:plastocyanin
MQWRPRLLKRPAGSRGRARKLANFGIALAVLSAPVITLVPGSDALAATAPVVAYKDGPCGALCWSPANFHVNAGDKVTWANGSGTHGLEQLNSGATWPASCPKNNPYPTCSFSQKGTYNFQCRVHHAAMTGSVTVDSGQPPQPQSHPLPTDATQAGPPPPANPAPTDTSQALLPSAPPSSASPSADPSGGTSAANNNRTNSGGRGSPAPLIIGVVVLLAIAGAAAYFIRARQTAGRSP